MIQVSTLVRTIILRHIDPNKKFKQQFALCKQEIIRNGLAVHDGEQANIFWHIVVSEFAELTGEALASEVVAEEIIRRDYAALPSELTRLDSIKPYMAVSV